MISLLRIRIKYIQRHGCLLFWTYLFLPGLIFLIGAIRLLTGRDEFKYVEYQPAQNKSGEFIFFKDGPYSKLKDYLDYTVFIVDEESKCPDIVNFISNKTDKKIPNINCTNYDKNITIKTRNIIKIQKDRNNRYRIYLNSRSNQFPFRTEYVLFNEKDLNQDNITNAFILNNFEENNKDKYEIFFELQSLLSKLLIEKFTNKKISSNFKVNLGLNPYPAHYKFSDEYDYYTYSFFSFLVALEFSLIAYNFNIRMIDEKENKLNILLERQGISKFKYNISWLITFYALFLFSIIGFLMAFISFLQFHYLLLIIIMIFYTFTIFSVCIFFTTCIKSTKTGTTAVKFYFFGSIFLGFVIVLSKANKLTKILFCFIPQINIYISMCSLFNLNNFENLSWDLIWLKANKMSYMESIIMYIASIIFYLGLSIIIDSYKNSGLNFFLYIKSLFTKVSRIDASNSLIDKNNSIIIEKDNNNTYHQELSPVNQQKKDQNQCLKILMI